MIMNSDCNSVQVCFYSDLFSKWQKAMQKKNTQDTSIDGERTSTMPSLCLMGVHTKFGGLSNPREEKGPPRQSVQQP